MKALDGFDPNKKYTKTELEALTDDILREQARAEVCAHCGELGNETGYIEKTKQAPRDQQGNQLVLDFPEYVCSNGHRWYFGEGKTRGIGGESPILFEEHIQSRRRREIYTSIGTPDPSIVAGSYNKTHPQGRKVNSEAQRKVNGASFYR